MSPLAPKALSPVLDDQIARNRRSAVLMLAGLVVAIVLVASLVGAVLGAGLLGLAVGVVVGAGAAVAAYIRSTGVIVSKSRASPADEAEYARLHNLVEGLCAGAGLPKPAVYVVDDQGLNAFVAGRSRRDAVVGVTTGLVGGLSRIELEGVVAHLLSRMKNQDTFAATVAVTVVGPLVRVLPAPSAARLVEVAAGGRREALADLTAVSLTRYPPGLISALEKMADRGTTVQSADRATAHLWLAPPLAGAGAPAFAVHLPLEERIAALREL